MVSNKFAIIASFGMVLALLVSGSGESEARPLAHEHGNSVARSGVSTRQGRFIQLTREEQTKQLQALEGAFGRDKCLELLCEVFMLDPDVAISHLKPTEHGDLFRKLPPGTPGADRLKEQKAPPVETKGEVQLKGDKQARLYNGPKKVNQLQPAVGTETIKRQVGESLTRNKSPYLSAL